MGKQKHHQEFQVQGKGSRKGKDKENKPTRYGAIISHLSSTFKECLLVFIVPDPK